MEEQGVDARFLIHDRDTKFTAEFTGLLNGAGVRCLRTPRMAPDANAFAEAWIGALKRECLDYFLCFGLSHLDHICQEYVRLFNEHRPHQGLGNRTIPAEAAGLPQDLTVAADPETGQVRCQHFLGGLLRHYDRDAA